MLTFIDNIQTWQFLVVGLVILGFFPIFLGEINFSPWVSAAIISVGFLDYLGTGPLTQLASLPIFFFIYIYLFKRLFSGNSKKVDESTDIHQMVGQSVRITSIKMEDTTMGEAISSKGQIWRVKNMEKNEIIKDHSYSCVGVEGIFLLIKQ